MACGHDNLRFAKIRESTISEGTLIIAKCPDCGALAVTSDLASEIQDIAATLKRVESLIKQK